MFRSVQQLMVFKNDNPFRLSLDKMFFVWTRVFHLVPIVKSPVLKHELWANIM